MRWLLAFVAPVAWAGASCLPCHPEQVRAYARSGMARSVGRPGGEVVGSFRHALSGSRVTVTATDGLRHRVERDGLTAEHPMALAIGSGKVGRSYAVRVGGYLFQSPASWFAQRGAWDVSPGFGAERHPDFDRPVTGECLFCHAGSTNAVAGFENRYGDPLRVEPIGCDRCHGDAERHAKAPGRGNVVNPARLTRAARDSVCEQCHLAGEARILNPGRRSADFRPGMVLEEVLTTYVQAREPGQAIRVNSHAEQLALSRCAQGSDGRLWCGTCHDPHPTRLRAAAEPCMGCHPSLPQSHPDGDCVGCHMPKSAVADVAHTVYTDHHIRRRPFEQAQPRQASRSLRPWREPPAPLAARNLGLAYLATGQRTRNAETVQLGFRLLMEGGWKEQNDSEVLSQLGAVLLQKQAPNEAEVLFRRAAKAEPGNARHLYWQAAAEAMQGRTDEAVRDAEAAVERDPSLLEAHALLVQVHRKRGDHDAERQAVERYLRFMPQSLAFRRLR